MRRFFTRTRTVNGHAFRERALTLALPPGAGWREARIRKGRKWVLAPVPATLLTPVLQ